MTEHDARLVPSAILSLLGCIGVTAGAVPWRVLVAVLAAAALAAGWGAALRASPRRAHDARLRSVLVCAAFACACAALLGCGAGVRLEARSPVALTEALASHADVELRGVVAREPTRGSVNLFTGEPRWEVRIDAAMIDGATVRLPVTALLDENPRLAPGDLVAVEGHLSASRSPRVAAAMWDARVVASERPALERRGFTAAIHSAREQFLELVAPYPDRVEGLTAGMVVGDDSAMPASQEEEMRRSGLAHLTAVSGSHFAIVTLVVMWLARRTRAARLAQAAAVAAVTAAFTVLVGPEPSVVRAAGMAAVMACALALGRRARALAALAASVLVLLAIDPWVAGSLGFCLSVVAVAAIAVWSPHLAVRLERWLVPRVARLVSIPIAAAVATAPLLVSLQGGIGAYVVPANIVAAPFAAPVTIVGLLALIAAPMSPAAGRMLVAFAAGLAQPVDATARAFAHAPGSLLPWPGTVWGAVALACIGIALMAATLARRVRGWGLLAAVMACAFAVTGPTVLAVARTPRLPDWDVIACDVGQGDMLLLRTAPRTAIVIDVGRASGASVDCLERHGIREVELLILTHPDADHDGDTGALLAAVPVRRAWISPVAGSAASTALLARRGVPFEFASAGMTFGSGPVELAVLAPSGSVAGLSDNDASVVVLADAGGTSVLALGDLEHEGQELLLATLPARVTVDVVKIAHHGSANQSEALAARVRARVGIVSVGAANPYGHPAPQTLDLYAPRVSAVVRTDECGDILLAAGPGFSLASRCPSDMAG